MRNRILNVLGCGDVLPFAFQSGKFLFVLTRQLCEKYRGVIK